MPIPDPKPAHWNQFRHIVDCPECGATTGFFEQTTIYGEGNDGDCASCKATLIPSKTKSLRGFLLVDKAGEVQPDTVPKKPKGF